MPDYFTPGVYMVEVPSGPRPIEGVATNVVALIGIAPNPRAPKNDATLINNWQQFETIFFGSNENPEWTPLAYAVKGLFDNAGPTGFCYVVAIGNDDPLRGGQKRAGLDLLEEIDEISIIAAPGYNKASDYEDLLGHCEKMGDRIAVLDGPEVVEDINLLTKATTAGEGESQGLRPRLSSFGAFYVPWLTVRDPRSTRKNEIKVNIPPSGHIAGIIARSDRNRGVHKAPANEVVAGIVGLSQKFTHQEQGLLNPEGVNVIRSFPDAIKVWGARTTDESSSPWRYLNVRRLFLYIEESIVDGTSWTVFEPNDPSLWKSIRRDVNAFLIRLWRDGALMGRTAEEAFFVECNNVTNPPENIDAGIVTIVVGVAPVKPAEFVVFRIQQRAGGAEVNETV
jgi:uncharacterized protein